MTLLALCEYARRAWAFEAIGFAMLFARVGGAVSNGLVEAEAEGTLYALGFGVVCVYVVGSVSVGAYPFDFRVLRVILFGQEEVEPTEATRAASKRANASQQRAADGLLLVCACLLSLRLGFAWRDHA